MKYVADDLSSARPLITEASMDLTGPEEVCPLRLQKDATKPEIATALETVFRRHQRWPAVNTVNMKAEDRRDSAMFTPVTASAWKKAIVTLTPDSADHRVLRRYELI